MDEETRERKREEIRRRIAASKAAAAAGGAQHVGGEPPSQGGTAVECGQSSLDAVHRSVPSQGSGAEACTLAASGAQRKSAEDLKSESTQDLLCALIKAIKFANPSWGQKKVCRSNL